MLIWSPLNLRPRRKQRFVRTILISYIASNHCAHDGAGNDRVKIKVLRMMNMMGYGLVKWLTLFDFFQNAVWTAVQKLSCGHCGAAKKQSSRRSSC